MLQAACLSLRLQKAILRATAVAECCRREYFRYLKVRKNRTECAVFKEIFTRIDGLPPRHGGELMEKKYAL